MDIRIIVALVISVVGIFLIASEGASNSRRQDKELLFGQRSFDRYRIKPRIGGCIIILISAASIYYLIYVILTR